MPRDWQMLPEVSQQLLRAARAGRLYKPPTPPLDEEEKETEEEAERPVSDSQKGFTVRKWAQIPRHMEPPEREYLAKRRKGLPSAHSGTPVRVVQAAAAPAAPPVMRKTKVRKTDPEGNVSVYEVLVAEGQTVEDEVLEETAEQIHEPIPAIAPGTVIDGVGVANEDGVVVAPIDIVQPTPPRRKGPPPRRKHKKGPGRGHKKVVVVEPGTEGSEQMEGIESNGLAAPPGKSEGATSVEGDTTMPDAPEGEDEDSGEEGEEGEEEEGSEEGEVVQTPPPDEPTSAPTAAADTPAPDPAGEAQQERPIDRLPEEALPLAVSPGRVEPAEPVLPRALPDVPTPSIRPEEAPDFVAPHQPTEEASTVPTAPVEVAMPDYVPPLSAEPTDKPAPDPEAQPPQVIELPEPPAQPLLSPLAPSLDVLPPRETVTSPPPELRLATPPGPPSQVVEPTTTVPIIEPPAVLEPPVAPVDPVDAALNAVEHPSLVEAEAEAEEKASDVAEQQGPKPAE